MPHPKSWCFVPLPRYRCLASNPQSMDCKLSKYWHYTHLSKGFLRKYECFEISEDNSGVCHVSVVGAQSLANSKSEKMEHSSKDTCVLEADFASFPGSLEHIVEYLHSYLSSHFFPYVCPVSSLNELYQKEYVLKCSHPVHCKYSVSERIFPFQSEEHL